MWLEELGGKAKKRKCREYSKIHVFIYKWAFKNNDHTCLAK